MSTEALKPSSIAGNPGRVPETGTGASFDAFFGSAALPGTKPVSIEEMNQAIEKGWAGEPD